MRSRDEIDAALIGMVAEPFRSELLQHDAEIKRFLWSYVAFKERMNKAGVFDRRDPQVVALLMCVARLVENYDACRVCSINGRPPAAKATLRMMYENFLNILVMGFHTGRIPKAIRHRNLREVPEFDEEVSRQYLAERFVGFGLFCRQQAAEHLEVANPEKWRHIIEQTPGGEEVAMENVASLKAGAELATERFHFDRYSLSWHPFAGLREVKNHLWPEGVQPMFPASDFEVERSYYDETFYFAFKDASHEIHGSPAALIYSFGEREQFEGLIHDTQYYEPAVMGIASYIFLWATRACAGALNVGEQWAIAFAS